MLYPWIKAYGVWSVCHWFIKSVCFVPTLYSGNTLAIPLATSYWTWALPKSSVGVSTKTARSALSAVTLVQSVVEFTILVTLSFEPLSPNKRTLKVPLKLESVCRILIVAPFINTIPKSCRSWCVPIRRPSASVWLILSVSRPYKSLVCTTLSWTISEDEVWELLVTEFDVFVVVDDSLELLLLFASRASIFSDTLFAFEVWFNLSLFNALFEALLETSETLLEVTFSVWLELENERTLEAVLFDVTELDCLFVLLELGTEEFTLFELSVDLLLLVKTTVLDEAVLSFTDSKCDSLLKVSALTLILLAVIPPKIINPNAVELNEIFQFFSNLLMSIYFSFQQIKILLKHFTQFK